MLGCVRLSKPGDLALCLPSSMSQLRRWLHIHTTARQSPQDLDRQKSKVHKQQARRHVQDDCGKTRSQSNSSSCRVPDVELSSLPPLRPLSSTPRPRPEEQHATAFVSLASCSTCLCGKLGCFCCSSRPPRRSNDEWQASSSPLPSPSLTHHPVSNASLSFHLHILISQDSLAKHSSRREVGSERERKGIQKERGRRH